MSDKKPTFARKAALALPSYSIKDKKSGESFFILVESEISSKNQTKADGSPDTDEKGQPKIIHHAMVTDLVTGERGEMVLPYIVKKAFDTVIDETGEIKGKAFELIKGRKINRTNEWTVFEIDPPK